MRHSQFLQIFLLTVLCLTISVIAEAGLASPLSHPEQFPYPDNEACYESAKTGCWIDVNEDGLFQVGFPSGLSSSAIRPAICGLGQPIVVNLYDPTTMSNSIKKMTSTQTTNLDIYIPCSNYQVPISQMNASADSKKATATIKINDLSLDGQTDNYQTALMNAGFKLKKGIWSATCSATRTSCVE